MPKKKKAKLSRLELEVMEPLWELEQASIRQIQESIPKDRRPEYTTAQTIINRLEAKGAVARIKKISNAHIYRPLINKKSAIGNLVEDFIDTLGGSVQPMMSHLVETRKISLKELKEIEVLLKSTSRKKKK